MFSSGPQPQLSSVCQSCHQSIPDIKCPHCHSFTQQLDYNYFDLFGCVRSLDIDLERLQQRYYALQQLTHPDQLHGLKVSERIKATALNQLINQAYKILKDKLHRAKYLFNYQESDHTITDPLLLTEIMDLQDELAELNESDKLIKFKDTIQHKFDDIFNQLKSIDSCQKSPLIVKLINSLNYYTKLLMQVNDKLSKQLNRFNNVIAN